MSDIVVNVTNAGAANVSVSSPATVNTTVGNGGAVNVSLGIISPGNATVVSGTVTINSTTTLSAGSNATVTNKGTAYAAVLDFGIPTGAAGPQGPQGPAGQNGTNGVTPTITASATTLAAGSSATVTATPSNGGQNVALAFGIPRGDPGTGGGSSNLTLSDGTPSALGTAAAGTSNLASRADHTHQLPVISYANLSGVPTNFPSNLTLVAGLQAALDGKQAAGNYVTSVNNLTGGLTLAPGSNVTITPSGSTLTIAASGGGVGANDVIDGGTYVGELLYGIVFGTQPQSQTVSSSLTVNLSSQNVTFTGGASGLGGLASFGGKLFSASYLTDSGIDYWQLLSSANDGANWSIVSQLDNGYAAGLGWLSGVASNGTRSLFTSGTRLFRSDASDLSTSTLISTPYANSVAWNGTRFVASYYQKTLTSAPGVFPPTYSYGRWLYSSSDGVNWTQRYNGGGDDDGGLPVVSVNGVFVLGRVGASQTTLTSADGVSWSPTTQSSYYGLSWASSGTKLVAVNGTTASYTTNGTTWSTATLPVSCNAISYAAGLFWAFRANQSSTDVCYSADGVTWTLGSMPSSTGWYQAAASSNSVFMQGINGSYVRSYARATIGQSYASANLTVSATAASGNPVSYQWQSSLDAGTSWSNVANATNSALNLTGLTQADNGTRYRALASATGATPATSQSATLTVTG